MEITFLLTDDMKGRYWNRTEFDMKLSFLQLIRKQLMNKYYCEAINTYKYYNYSGSKPILRGVSGKFRGGEITAILGPSGAGKSTLLNILAGYVCAGVSGSIKINDNPRNVKKFNKISNYIMQEDLLQDRLSVEESMFFASRLKVGGDVTDEERQSNIRDILETLGLESHRETRKECLSGGQRKRLSVALELVSNPTVILLDEPTTGLDIVCIKQVVGALKTLANQGRTILCTIHQPTASEFKLFDQVYFMADGNCIYNGSTTNLVPFLDSVGLPCPKTYSPADYIIELVNMDHNNTQVMSTAVNNGRTELRSIVDSSKFASNLQLDYPTYTCDKRPSFGNQFSTLLKRMLLQKYRSLATLQLQLIHHIISGILLGGIFFNIGNNASMAISNFKLCISILVFFVYTYALIPVLTFPSEVKLLKREYFNRWYGLKAYYAALTVSQLPAMIVNSLIFLLITFFMTAQPPDAHRFLYYSLFGILTGICSEGYGILVGSVFNVTNGCLVGPATVAPMVALAIYGMGYGPVIEPFMLVIMRLTFVRYGIVGLAKTLYGLDRGFMDCEELYCHYKDPGLLLRDLGMQDQLLMVQFLGVIVFTIFYRLLAYLGLRYRLTNEFNSRILNYAKKILKHK